MWNGVDAVGLTPWIFNGDLFLKAWVKFTCFLVANSTYYFIVTSLNVPIKEADSWVFFEWVTLVNWWTLPSRESEK